jgi:large subunit ribosomal protein L28
MPKSCEVCGKAPTVGNSITTRGKAKYLGGVGRKVTGKSKRKFRPNLQRVKVEINGQVMTIRVAVSVIRSGLIKRPVKRKPFTMPQI